MVDPRGEIAEALGGEDFRRRYRRRGGDGSRSSSGGLISIVSVGGRFRSGIGGVSFALFGGFGGEAVVEAARGFVVGGGEGHEAGEGAGGVVFEGQGVGFGGVMGQFADGEGEGSGCGWEVVAMRVI